MRRALAAAILGISFWVGSLAWTGFVLTRTVLDPERSRDVAEALYDDEAVRAQLADNVADAADAAIPPEAPVPRPVIENAAARALESPAAERIFVDALVRTHGAFLGEGEAPEAVEAGAVGVAARQAMIEARPALDGVLPDAPELRVPLPTERIPDFGPVRDVVRSAVPVLAGLSGAGALLALLVTSNRPAVIRRAGFWGIGLSAAVLFFAYGIPAVVARVAPEQSQIIAALVGAMAAATRGPALALAATGIGAVALSFAWRAAASSSDVAGSPTDGPGAFPGTRSATGATTWLRRRDVPTPGRRPVPRPPVPSGSEVTSAVATGAVPRPRDPDGYARGPVRPPPDPHLGYPEQAPVAQVRPRHGRRWADGVGWVLDGSEPIPPEARWVPGVGYVVDE